MQAKKIAMLEERFAELRWAPLTESEKARFVLTNEENAALVEKYLPELCAKNAVSVVNFPIGEPHPHTMKKK